MKLFYIFSIIVGVAATTTNAVLPPGYEDDLFCPPDNCQMDDVAIMDPTNNLIFISPLSLYLSLSLPLCHSGIRSVATLSNAK